MKQLTQTEHLQLIRARCVELLEIAEKRTAGAWKAGGKWDKDYVDVGDEAFCTMHRSNAAFIASCAGAAEAGWRATIAAVDAIFAGYDGDCSAMFYADMLADSVTSSWPIELLNNK